MMIFSILIKIVISPLRASGSLQALQKYTLGSPGGIFTFDHKIRLTSVIFWWRIWVRPERRVPHLVGLGLRGDGGHERSVVGESPLHLFGCRRRGLIHAADVQVRVDPTGAAVADPYNPLDVVAAEDCRERRVEALASAGAVREALPTFETWFRKIHL